MTVDFSTVLASSVVAATVTFILNVGVKVFDSNRSARNNALYAAIVLEEWAVGCFNVWADMADYHETKGQLGLPHDALPELVNLRKEIDLNTIGVKLRAEILTLFARVNISNNEIGEYLHRDSVHTAGDHAAERGLEAIALAEKLRKGYFLPKNTDETYLRNVKSITGGHADLMKSRAKARAQWSSATGKG